MTDCVPPIFVISLARSHTRRRRMRQQLDQLGLHACIVNACDGMTLSERDVELAGAPAGRPPARVPLTRGEIGCLLSHCALYERIVTQQMPLACILEDDCRLTPEFVRVLQTIDPRTAAWDVLLLGHHSSRHDAGVGAETCYRSVPVGDGSRLARVAEFPMGAYAYVVTLSGAHTLLRHARPPRMPADWVVGYSPAAGARLFAVKPPCVTPDAALADQTTIDGRGGGDSRSDTRRWWRQWIGRALLLTRKAGFWPDGYVKNI